MSWFWGILVQVLRSLDCVSIRYELNRHLVAPSSNFKEVRGMTISAVK